LAVCEEFDEETVAKDGTSPPWMVFEWYFVEAMVRRPVQEEGGRLPGRRKAAQAVADGVPLSRSRYLKAAEDFGFHGVYRGLARELGIERDGRLGAVGFELVEQWAKEQELPGFAVGGRLAGAEKRRMLVEAVRDGLEKGAVARSPSWSGWSFFRDHLDFQRPARREAKFLSDRLRDDPLGHRREVWDFLGSSAGREAWREANQDAPFHERRFHDALRRAAGRELKRLLGAIQAYERFARLCQDAFDDCLRELSRSSKKTYPTTLSQLPGVRRAHRRVPELWGSVREKLVSFDQAERFREVFAELAEKGNATEWVERLLEHHWRVQRRKPPDGRAAWFDRFDDGGLIIRPHYRRSESEQRAKSGWRDEPYVHGYRTRSLGNFAMDLKWLKP
jgi:hypothetical protein